VDLCRKQKTGINIRLLSLKREGGKRERGGGGGGGEQTLPVKGTMWCSQREKMSMSLTITISS